MTETEVEHRLTAVEARAKSNTHRLEEVESIVNEIHTMSNTMVQLVQEMKHTNETVDGLNQKIDRMDSRVDAMEQAPAKKWRDAGKTVINTILGAAVGFLAAGLLWAAVQAF